MDKNAGMEPKIPPEILRMVFNMSYDKARNAGKDVTAWSEPPFDRSSPEQLLALLDRARENRVLWDDFVLNVDEAVELFDQSFRQLPPLRLPTTRGDWRLSSTKRQDRVRSNDLGPVLTKWHSPNLRTATPGTDRLDWKDDEVSGLIITFGSNTGIAGGYKLSVHGRYYRLYAVGPVITEPENPDLASASSAVCCTIVAGLFLELGRSPSDRQRLADSSAAFLFRKAMHTNWAGLEKNSKQDFVSGIMTALEEGGCHRENAANVWSHCAGLLPSAAMELISKRSLQASPDDSTQWARYVVYTLDISVDSREQPAKTMRHHLQRWIDGKNGERSGVIDPFGVTGCELCIVNEPPPLLCISVHDTSPDSPPEQIVKGCCTQRLDLRLPFVSVLPNGQHEQSEERVRYFWLGGIYRQQSQHRVYWRDDPWGDYEHTATLRLFDPEFPKPSRRWQGSMIGSVQSEACNDDEHIPAVWRPEMLFYERAEWE